MQVMGKSRGKIQRLGLILLVISYFAIGSLHVFCGLFSRPPLIRFSP